LFVEVPLRFLLRLLLPLVALDSLSRSSGGAFFSGFFRTLKAAFRNLASLGSILGTTGTGISGLLMRILSSTLILGSIASRSLAARSVGTTGGKRKGILRRM